jgi:disulfide bond formation protein DsbB
MEPVEPTQGKHGLSWALISLALATAATLGSLYLSIGMGLKACPLCFYQRTFMMAALTVLAIGLATDRSQARLLSIVSLPLAVAGWGVAAFHEYLVVTGKLECPAGVFGLGVAPMQSLAMFSLLAVTIGLGAGRPMVPLAASVALGLALAWGCIASSPPMASAPTKPYEQPLEICRPPFKPS